jgi:hypothetical protein
VIVAEDNKLKDVVKVSRTYLINKTTQKFNNSFSILSFKLSDCHLFFDLGHDAFKGTFSQKVAEIISLYHRFGPNKGTPTLFKFLKLCFKKLKLFMWGLS